MIGLDLPSVGEMPIIDLRTTAPSGIPVCECVYLLLNDELSVIYVGETVNLRVRMSSHQYRKKATFVCYYECKGGYDQRDMVETIYKFKFFKCRRITPLANAELCDTHQEDIQILHEALARLWFT